MNFEEMDEREMERQIEELEKELRGLGAPYVSPEPDERYWGSFRMSVMDKIEAREQARDPRSWFAPVKKWFAEHLLGSSLVGAGAATAIAIMMAIHPDSSSRVAEIQKPVAESPAPRISEQHDVAQVQQAAEVLSSKPVATHHSDLAARTSHEKSLDKKQIQMSERFAFAAERSAEDESISRAEVFASPADEVVSLNDLSASELESVLQNLSNK